MAAWRLGLGYAKYAFSKITGKKRKSLSYLFPIVTKGKRYGFMLLKELAKEYEFNCQARELLERTTHNYAIQIA